jgi:nitrite reductase/ring-hydroxylating ferredoxin subunit
VTTEARPDLSMDPRADAEPDLIDASGTAGLDRRTVLRGACLVCVGVGAAGALAACGGSSGGDPSDASGGGSAPIKTSDIPVGGGKVFDSAKVVVTQPKAGEFKAFTAVCTHQQFLVGNVQGGTINCLHHGSMYDMTTGAVVGGPAPSPLAAKTVTVTGDTLTVT